MKNRILNRIKKISKKLCDISGETIAETLVSMLISVLAFIMLSGAIVAAARVNNLKEEKTMYLNMADPDSESNKVLPGAKVSITSDSRGTIISDIAVNVKTYKSKDASGTLYYYE